MRNPKPEAKPEDFRLLILTMAKQMTVLTDAVRTLLRHSIIYNEAIKKYPPANVSGEDLKTLQEVANGEEKLRVSLLDLLKDMEKAIMNL